MEKDRIDRMSAMEIYRYLRSMGYSRRDAYRNIKAQLSSWPLIRECEKKWITHIPTGAQWSVVDAQGAPAVFGFDFEIVTEEEI